MIRFVDRTGSTNDDVRLLGAAGAPHGTCIVASAQDHGRGRLGRRWESENNGNVYLSVLLRCALSAQHVPLICLAAAVATADACGEGCGIKWPNDVLASDGRKLAGILAEAEWRGGGLDFVVLGIGVNIAAAPIPQAAQLAHAQERVPFATDLVRRVLAEVELLTASPRDLLARWRARSVTLKRSVVVDNVEGIAEDVAPDGALLVRDAQGQLHRILSGDVWLI